MHGLRTASLPRPVLQTRLAISQSPTSPPHPHHSRYFAGGMFPPEYDHLVVHIRDKAAEHPVATVAAEQLARSWDSEELAKTLMAQHGGLGAGLFHPKIAEKLGAAAVPAVPAAAQKPRVLIIPSVLQLTDKVGPREQLYRDHEREDFNVMSCPWIQNKPFV